MCTIKDVGSIQSLLLLLQHVHVEGSSVSHLIITVHHAPTRTDTSHITNNVSSVFFVFLKLKWSRNKTNKQK